MNFNFLHDVIARLTKSRISEYQLLFLGESASSSLRKMDSESEFLTEAGRRWSRNLSLQREKPSKTINFIRLFRSLLCTALELLLIHQHRSIFSPSIGKVSIIIYRPSTGARVVFACAGRSDRQNQSNRILCLVRFIGNSEFCAIPGGTGSDVNCFSMEKRTDMKVNACQRTHSNSFFFLRKLSPNKSL